MRAWVGYLPDAGIDAVITVGRPIGFLWDSLPSRTSFMSYVWNSYILRLRNGIYSTRINHWIQRLLTCS